MEALLGLLYIFPLGFTFILWWVKGKDDSIGDTEVFYENDQRKQSKKPLLHRNNIPLFYEPLKNITPSQAGVLLDEEVNEHDIVAEIIEMVRIGVINLTPMYETGSQFPNDYKFTLKEKSTKQLQVHQLAIVRSLFSHRNTQYISKLKGVFHIYYETIRYQILKSMKDDGFHSYDQKTLFFFQFCIYSQFTLISIIYAYLTNDYFFLIFTSAFVISINTLLYKNSFPQSAKNDYRFLLPFLIIIIPASIVIAYNHLIGSFSVTNIFMYCIQPSLVIILAKNMNKKTKKGQIKYLQIKGLKESLKRGRWRHQKKEQDHYIDIFVPYAVALGITNVFKNRFKDLYHVPSEKELHKHITFWGPQLDALISYSKN